MRGWTMPTIVVATIACGCGSADDCGDDVVQPGNLCFTAPTHAVHDGATELLELREPGAVSLFAYSEGDPRLRRLRPDGDGDLGVEWFLAEFTPYATLVRDLDEDGWDDVIFGSVVQPGVVTTSIGEDAIEFQFYSALGWPLTFVEPTDDLPLRAVAPRMEELFWWLVFPQGVAPGGTIPVGPGAQVEAGDLDGDTMPELVVVSGDLDARSLSSFRPDGVTFVSRAETIPVFSIEAMRVVDIDEDGADEVLAIDREGIDIFGFQPDLGLDRAESLAGEWRDVLVSDVDADAHADLVLLGAEGLTIWSVLPDGGRTERTIAVAGGASAAQTFDVDEDGNDDIVVANRDGIFVLFADA